MKPPKTIRNENLYVVYVRLEKDGQEFNANFPTKADGFDDAVRNAKAAAIALGVNFEFVSSIES